MNPLHCLEFFKFLFSRESEGWLRSQGQRSIGKNQIEYTTCHFCEASALEISVGSSQPFEALEIQRHVDPYQTSSLGRGGVKFTESQLV